jgi:sec-independent protein translocase protein TatC
VDYADGAVESLWSIDQYFEFVLVLMLSTGLSFQARGRQGSAELLTQG